MKKTGLIIKAMQVLLLVMIGLVFVIHGVVIFNTAEIFIGALVVFLSWKLFVDREYGKSLRDALCNRK